MKTKNILGGGLLILGFMAPSFVFAANNTFCDQLIKSGFNTETKKVEKSFVTASDKTSRELARDEKLAKAKNISDIKNIKSTTDKENKTTTKLSNAQSKASTSSQKAALLAYNTTIAKLINDRITSNTNAITKYEDDMTKAISTRNSKTNSLLASYKNAIDAALAQATEDCQDSISAQAKDNYINSIKNALSSFNTNVAAETQSFAQSIVSGRSARSTSIESAKGKFQTAANEAKQLLVNAWVPPTVVSFSPADNSTGVSTTNDLVITFSEPVVGESGNITIYYDGGSQQLQGISSDLLTGSGTNVIKIKANLISGKNYYVIIDSGAFVDLGGSYYAGLSNPRTWSFSTK